MMKDESELASHSPSLSLLFSASSIFSSADYDMWKSRNLSWMNAQYLTWLLAPYTCGSGLVVQPLDDDGEAGGAEAPAQSRVHVLKYETFLELQTNIVIWGYPRCT